MWKEKGDGECVWARGENVVDAGERVNKSKNVGLNLKVVLRDVDGDHSVGPFGCDEPFEEDPVFLAQEWKPGLGSCGGEWRCVLIPPACEKFALESG